MTSSLETSAITWGGTRLTYAIRRSARRKKTVAVTVDPGGRVLLLAPEDFPTSRLDEVARRKAGWIVQRLRGVGSNGVPPSPREFVSGESVMYLGRHYRLKVLPGETGEAKLRGGWLHVPAPQGRSSGTTCERRWSPGFGVMPPRGCRKGWRCGGRGPVWRCPVW